ncbi:hypothetical protein KNE206_18620 [Kitasatospora sp. NE20-6]
MTETTTHRVCERAGCRFPRLYLPKVAGRKRKRSRYCGSQCHVWSARARRVSLMSGAEAAADAAELLRLSVLLDARQSPDEEVAGVFDHARRQRP